MENDFCWWRDGVIYQVYVRSFADGNGDGLGDLPGLISRLDYLRDLGVDALWLSPIYPSPDGAVGDDVAAHATVDPRAGTPADFDRLLAEAHRRGIRIVLDMVMNHTSDRHPWFLESRAGRASVRRDWYIWRDRPNNWKAVFGGSAWTRDPASGQYYLHLFAAEQPDLNWRNPAVRAAQLEVFRSWLDRGVDGFRLDVFNAYFKDPELRNNPRKLGLRAFDRQRHLHDIDQPEMGPLLRELRGLLDSYPQRYSVGETFLASPARTVSYCGSQALHAAFSFDFTAADLSFPWDPRWIARRVDARESVFDAAGAWPTTVMSNHDLPRAAGRYCEGEDDAQAKIAMALLLTLRGTPFLYYGEEIGMRDIRLRRREILDPPGRRYWPFYRGRDGCRAPMQWDGSANAGFSPAGFSPAGFSPTGSARPWLPVHPDHERRNVESQSTDPGSLLSFTRALIALRRQAPALVSGD
ncbi:MAG TPA: alpha-glucosidase, partial [Spirochaetia bacterium]|nr:alpha-glucosidase [Spirochaetia bacterium]